jgi:hypothetical protein
VGREGKPRASSSSPSVDSFPCPHYATREEEKEGGIWGQWEREGIKCSFTENETFVSRKQPLDCSPSQLYPSTLNIMYLLHCWADSTLGSYYWASALIRVHTCEIHGGRSSIVEGFSARFFAFPFLIICHHPLLCEIALNGQHTITTSVFNLEALTLSRHLQNKIVSLYKVCNVQNLVHM